MFVFADGAGTFMMRIFCGWKSFGSTVIGLQCISYWVLSMQWGSGGGYLCKRPPSIAALHFVILEARIILQQQRRAMCKCKSTEQWALSILFIFQRKILTYTASLCIILSASLISLFDPGWFKASQHQQWRQRCKKRQMRQIYLCYFFFSWC